MLHTHIKELRLAKNLTQAQLAKALNVSPYIIRNWEAGKTVYGSGLIKLALFFDCSSDYLLGLRDSLGNKINLVD